MKDNVNGSSGTTVCVTGAAGFIGSWLIMRLLERGYVVRATVRDPGLCPRPTPSFSKTSGFSLVTIYSLVSANIGNHNHVLSLFLMITGYPGWLHIFIVRNGNSQSLSQRKYCTVRMDVSSNHKIGSKTFLLTKKIPMNVKSWCIQLLIGYDDTIDFGWYICLIK